MLIARLQKLERIAELVDEAPAVALLGPRQVGKTTLALDLAESRDSIYLDLESPADLSKLTEPELYLQEHRDKLVILDEIQRVPDLFPVLRGVIDRARREGKRAGSFLILGSAAPDLLRQSSESLAGRIIYEELTPFGIDEVDDSDRLWLRGGFPESYLARSTDASCRWRSNFLRTYLERDIPQLGSRVPAETLRRFWTMLAHHQGGLLNAASLARGLAVDGKTIAHYLDLLVDLLLVRRLSPWSGNLGKRLVRSPKVYVRDSGLLHQLLGIPEKEDLLGNPIIGESWEGFVVETILNRLPQDAKASFYRTAMGAEIDLVIETPSKQTIAVEIKRSLSPKVSKGFHSGCIDVRADRKYVVYPGDESYTISEGIRVVGVKGFLEDL